MPRVSKNTNVAISTPTPTPTPTAQQSSPGRMSPGRASPKRMQTANTVKMVVLVMLLLLFVALILYMILRKKDHKTLIVNTISPSLSQSLKYAGSTAWSDASTGIPANLQVLDIYLQPTTPTSWSSFFANGQTPSVMVQALPSYNPAPIVIYSNNDYLTNSANTLVLFTRKHHTDMANSLVDAIPDSVWDTLTAPGAVDYTIQFKVFMSPDGNTWTPVPAFITGTTFGF
jgi:hypothetical protein